MSSFCHGGLCLHMVCTRQSGGQRAPPAARAGDRPEVFSRLELTNPKGASVEEGGGSFGLQLE